MALVDTDVWCDGDFRPDMPEVSGRELHIQDLRNRLESAPGSLAWDPLGVDYGYDLRTLIGKKIRNLDSESRRIADECEKDERTELAQVSIKADNAGALRVQIRIFDENGTYDFTLLVTELTVSILTQGP